MWSFSVGLPFCVFPRFKLAVSFYSFETYSSICDLTLSWRFWMFAFRCGGKILGTLQALWMISYSNSFQVAIAHAMHCNKSSWVRSKSLELFVFVFAYYSKVQATNLHLYLNFRSNYHFLIQRLRERKNKA